MKRWEAALPAAATFAAGVTFGRGLTDGFTPFMVFAVVVALLAAVVWIWRS